MNELTDIANVLTNDKQSLSSGLFKLKLLAGRLQNRDLENWLIPELTGYKVQNPIPNYRVTKGFLQIIHQDAREQTFIKEFTSFVKDEKCKIVLNNISIPEDVASLEYYTKDNSLQPFRVSVPEWFPTAIYEDIKANEKYNYMNIHEIYVVVLPSVFASILSNIRFYALGLITDLENTLGYDVDIRALLLQKKEGNEVVNNYFNENNIYTFGSNNIANLGNENAVNI